MLPFKTKLILLFGVITFIPAFLSIVSAIFFVRSMFDLFLYPLVIWLFSMAFAYYSFRHPVIEALKQKGILTLMLDSRGIVKVGLSKIIPDPYSVRIRMPDGMEFVYSRDEFWIIVFGSDFGMPVILYNEVTKTPITKYNLSKMEEAYISHLVLDMVHKVTSINNDMRNFIKGIMELLSPKKSFLVNPSNLFIIIFLIIMAIAIIMLLTNMSIFPTPAPAAPPANPSPTGPVAPTS
jgi:hypothetical protein